MTCLHSLVSRFCELCSRFVSDGVDEYTVNKLLCQVFMSGSISTEGIFSIIKESASRKYDVKEEVLHAATFSSSSYAFSFDFDFPIKIFLN